MNRIYVGNLPYSVDQAQLAEMFAPAGTVTDTAIPMNERRLPKGFAFVEFETKEQMENAIKMFDGKDVGGRTLRVNEARPREERSDRPMSSAPREEKVEVSADDTPSDDTPADDAAASDDDSSDDAADAADAASDDDADEKNEDAPADDKNKDDDKE